MRIAFVIPDLALGGAQRQVMLLAEALSRQPNTEVLLITFRNSGQFERTFKNLQLKKIDLNVVSGFNPMAAVKLRAVIKSHQTEVLISWLHAADVMSFLATRSLQTKWVISERDSTYPIKLRYRIRELIGQYADAVIANSSSGSDFWKKLSYNKKIYVLNNIVLKNKSIPEKQIEFDVTFIGRFEPQKNVLRILEVFQILANQNTKIRMALIGEGSLREACSKYIVDSELEGRVVILPFQERVSELMLSSRVILNLSLHEGTPNVVLEAISLKKLVVLSDISGHRDIVGNRYPFLVDLSQKNDHIARIIMDALSSYFNYNLDIISGRLKRYEEQIVIKKFRKIMKEII